MTLAVTTDERFLLLPPPHHHQADYYTCIATIVYLRKENCLYQACPSQDCNKKVVDQQNGMYRCEKCDKEFPNFKYRLILSVSDSFLFSAFPRSATNTPAPKSYVNTPGVKAEMISAL